VGAHIRTAIFALHKPGADSVRVALATAVDEAAQLLGFRPRLTVTGPLDLAVTDALRSELLAVVGEALSNVVKHARATAVRINIAVGSGQVAVRITDDGCGIGGPDGNGMTNLRGRATDRGGGFTVTPAEPHGTVLTWTVPLNS
jgi:signal transduction histidine kinase